MKKLLCASTAGLAFHLASAMLAPAFAADLGVAPIYKLPPVPVSIWTGSYVGASAGGSWGSAVVHNDVTGDQTPRFDLSGGIIGMTTGFNVQRGSLVLGLESDTSAMSTKGTAPEFPPNSVFSNEVSGHWLSTFRGRVGYAQNNWLFYATGGGVVVGVENTIVGPPGHISESHWHWGLTAGGGVEVKLTPDWSAKVEYLYLGLQDKAYFNPAPSVAFPSAQRLHPDGHIVRVGVNYKLPWGVLDTFFKR